MGYDTSLLLLMYAAMLCTAVAHAAAFGSSRTVRGLLLAGVAGILLVIFALLGDWNAFSSRLSVPRVTFAVLGPVLIAAGPPRLLTSRLGRAWGLVALIWIGFLLFRDFGQRCVWVAVVGPAADLAASALAVVWLTATGDPGAARHRTAWSDTSTTTAGLSIFICIAAAVGMVSDQFFGLPPLLAIVTFAAVGCASVVLWRGYIRALLLVDHPPARPARSWLAVVFVVLVSGGSLLVLPTVLVAGKRLRPTLADLLPNASLVASVQPEPVRAARTAVKSPVASVI